MINYFYSTSKTPIDEDKKLALIPDLNTLEELNRWEQENIIEGRKWAMSNNVLKRNEIFTFDFLVKLHQKMFDKTWKWAGQIRESHRNIGCEIDEILPEVKKLNQDAIFWMENFAHLAEEVALIYHHRLVKIHLFQNGGGCHARLVADCIIKKYGTKNKIKWEGQEQIVSENLRKQYIEALKKADEGSYEHLTSLFLSNNN